MLVLSRKKSERIFVDGGLIVVTVVEIRGDKVRLGISAPPQITVHRNEVHNAILRDRAAADLPTPVAGTGHAAAAIADAAICGDRTLQITFRSMEAMAAAMNRGRIDLHPTEPVPIPSVLCPPETSNPGS